MGILCTLPMFQLIMTKTLRGLDVLVYIDDIVVTQQQSQSTEDHLIQVEKMLGQPQSAGFSTNFKNVSSCRKVLNTWGAN